MHTHREADAFQSKDLAALASRIEAEFGEAFRRYGARLRLVPNTWPHLLEIGEGFEINLIPEKPETWEYWGDFETCREVLRRRSWSQKRTFISSLEDTEELTRKQIRKYLDTLSSKTARA